MRLLDLTPAEIAFLAAPRIPAYGLPTRLSQRLAATLSARLRLAVRLQPDTIATSADEAPTQPRWQVDAALATLWLTRRLGGQRVVGTTAFVPRSLIQTLDTVLAEYWLDAVAHAVHPHALQWQVAGDFAQARLGVQLPHDPHHMTRWAREVIGHG